ncbi:MAG: SdpI family protein [Actinomycetota bacterium]|nr:SdpI family protein [Actinomycetota bacterium]
MNVPMNPASVSVTELNQNTSGVLTRAKRGEHVAITDEHCASATSYPHRVPDAIRVTVAVAALLAALALAAVAACALTGHLHRNRWAGVRTPATMASNEAFQLGNRVAAIPTLAAAAPLVVAAVAALALRGPVAAVTVLLCLAGTTSMVVVGGLLGNTAASGCATERCADCTGCALMESPSARGAPRPLRSD